MGGEWRIGYALSAKLTESNLRQTFAGEVPFSNKRKVAAVVSMWKGCRPTRPHHPELSNSLWRMIQACWEADPGQRMSIAEVVTVLEEEVAAHRSKPRWMYRHRS